MVYFFKLYCELKIPLNFVHSERIEFGIRNALSHNKFTMVSFVTEYEINENFSNTSTFLLQT